jgi:serine/threonine protein kinase
MILQDSYQGEKVDIWSIGCIFLELILGHDIFCDRWVPAYNHAIIRDRSSFATSMKTAIQRLPSLISSSYSYEFTTIILQILRVNPCERPSIFELSQLDYVKESSPPMNKSIQVSASVTTMKMNLLPLATLSTDNSSSSMDSLRSPASKARQLDVSSSLSPLLKNSSPDAAGVMSRSASQVNHFPGLATPKTPEHLRGRRSDAGASSYFDWFPLPQRLNPSMRMNSTGSEVSNAPSHTSNPRMNSEEFPMISMGANERIRSRGSMIRETISKLQEKKT